MNHVHICKKKPADAEDITVDKKKTTSRPQLFICGICGRFVQTYPFQYLFILVSSEYGTASISIHLPQCFEQFKNEQTLIDPIARRPLPDLDAMLKEIEEIKADKKVTSSELKQQRENAMKSYKEFVLIFICYGFHFISVSTTEDLPNVQRAIAHLNLRLFSSTSRPAASENSNSPKCLFQKVMNPLMTSKAIILIRSNHLLALFSIFLGVLFL